MDAMKMFNLVSRVISPSGSFSFKYRSKCKYEPDAVYQHEMAGICFFYYRLAEIEEMKF